MKRKHNASSSEDQDIHHHILPTNARVIHVSYKVSFHLREIFRLPLIDKCTKDIFVTFLDVSTSCEKHEHRVRVKHDMSHGTGLLGNFINYDQFQSVLFGCLYKFRSNIRVQKKDYILNYTQQMR